MRKPGHELHNEERAQEDRYPKKCIHLDSL